MLVIGGQFSGTFTAKDLTEHFYVAVVDAKEFFEYTPGILRANVKPVHFDPCPSRSSRCWSARNAALGCGL